MGGIGSILSGIAAIGGLFAQFKALDEAKRMNDFNIKLAKTQSANVATDQHNRFARAEAVQAGLDGDHSTAKNPDYEDYQTV